MDVKDILPVFAVVAAVGGAGINYGITQGEVHSLSSALADLKAEHAKDKEVLHRRASTNAAAISELNRSALERVTDVEVKITKLDSKIDQYNSAAQLTMQRILDRIQKDLHQ